MYLNGWMTEMQCIQTNADMQYVHTVNVMTYVYLL